MTDDGQVNKDDQSSVTAVSSHDTSPLSGGATRIADSVVSRIVGLAAREIPGIHELTSAGLPQSFGSRIAERVTGQEQLDRGVVVEVGDKDCVIGLNIVVTYEASIPEITAALRRIIHERVEAMTGLVIKEININVADLYFPPQSN